MFTVDRLQLRAQAALRQMKQELMTSGAVTPVCRAFLRGGGTQDFAIPPSLERMFHNARAKDVFFDFMRRYTITGDVGAWVFGSDMWFARQTEAGKKMPIDEYRRHVDLGFVDLQKSGLAVVEEALSVVAQTDTHVLLLHQVYLREPRLRMAGPVQETRMSQQLYGGRTKMWGPMPADTGIDSDLLPDGMRLLRRG